jgi:hypothetical protein
MGYGKRVNENVLKFKRASGLELDKSNGTKQLSDLTTGRITDKNRQIILSRQSSHPSNMVAVLMSDNDTINLGTRHSQGRKPCRYLPGRHAGVDKELRPLRFDIQGVSLASAGKKTDPHMSSRKNRAIKSRDERALPVPVKKISALVTLGTPVLAAFMVIN